MFVLTILNWTYGVKPQSTTSSHFEVKKIESEEDLGRLSPNDPHSYANIEAVITTHIHIELETKFYEKEDNAFVKLEGFVILYLWKRNKTTVRRLYFATAVFALFLCEILMKFETQGQF